LEETKYLYGASIIIAEGIMALQEASLRNLYDLKVNVSSSYKLLFAEQEVIGLRAVRLAA
jgi:uridine kinase